MQSETSVKVEQLKTAAAAQVAVLRFHGDITSTSKAAVLDAYRGLPAGTGRIVLDFSKVDYLNSSGIAILIQLLMEGHKTSQSIHSFGLSAHFQKVFAMVGITKYTHLYPDEPTALASFA
ncbi:MAG TPA: STAS domain-containing protein [Acidisarcina sp.]